MDIIKIKGLKIFANHGVYPEEIENGQNFVLDVWLYLNTLKAGKLDDLRFTVDYDKFCGFVKDNFLVKGPCLSCFFCNWTFFK